VSHFEMQSVGSRSSVEDSCLVVVVLADNFPEISNAGFYGPDALPDSASRQPHE